MKRFHFISATLLFLVAIFYTGTNAASQAKDQFFSAEEQHLVDSILGEGLDHEALYTILGNIKPMSSLLTFWFPIANADTLSKGEWRIVDRETKGQYLDKLYAAQQAINKLSFPDLKFILVPYQAAQGDIRIVQLSVVRISLLDSILKAKEEFFGQYGLVPGADPVVVASVVENASTYDRNRAYGYLFGYPDYAVDFFTEATIKSVEEDEFIPRNFFQIPVYARESGCFVYAYPEGYEPTAIDSTLYNRAVKVLNDYKNIRDRYMNADSTVNAYRLLKDYLKE